MSPFAEYLGGSYHHSSYHDYPAAAANEVVEWMEDFRLYCLSFWPEVYAFSSEISSEKIWRRVINLWHKSWICFSRQSFYLQFLLVALALATSLLLLCRLWARLHSRVCRSKARMDGKTVIITGANSGVGLETARDLVARGARVILACRNMEKGVAAAEDIIESLAVKKQGGTGPCETDDGYYAGLDVVVRRLDLSCTRDVRRFCKQILAVEERLDVLILNAEIALNQKYLTEDGFELHLAVNYLGHFLAANLLAPLMVRTAAKTALYYSEGGRSPVGGCGCGRVVVVSSVAHWFGRMEVDNLNSEERYDVRETLKQSSRAYSNTKLANLLFALELARRLRRSNVSVNAVNPGPVRTGDDLSSLRPHHLLGFLFGFKTPAEGAQTSIHLAAAEEVEGVTGRYFSECRPARSSAEGAAAAAATRLWERSAEMLQMEAEEEVPEPTETS